MSFETVVDGRRLPATRRALALICAMAAATGLGCRSRPGPGEGSSGVAGRAAVTDAPFRIVATDTGFIASSSIPAGIRHIVFENRGAQIHEAMLVKLPEGMEAADYVKAEQGGDLFPKGALDYSGPGLTSPGESTELWLRLDPGRYLLFCFNEGHSRTAPAHEFTVTSATVDDSVPPAEVLVRLVDFSFQLVGTVRSGLQVIRIETPGPSMHEADIYRLPEGATVEDVKRWYREGSAGAPARALGGALDNHDIGRVVVVRRRFDPGRYVLHCAMPTSQAPSKNRKHVTHADMGMALAFDVVE
jgi:hypothetical protein